MDGSSLAGLFAPWFILWLLALIITIIAGRAFGLAACRSSFPGSIKAHQKLDQALPNHTASVTADPYSLRGRVCSPVDFIDEHQVWL